MEFYSKHVFICTNQKPDGKKCCAEVSLVGDFFGFLKQRIADAGQLGPGQIRVTRSGCLGRCGVGPCIVVYPEGVWFTYETQEDVAEIADQYLLGNKLVSRLLIP